MLLSIHPNRAFGDNLLTNSLHFVESQILHQVWSSWPSISIQFLPINPSSFLGFQGNWHMMKYPFLMPSVSKFICDSRQVSAFFNLFDSYIGFTGRGLPHRKTIPEISPMSPRGWCWGDRCKRKAMAFHLAVKKSSHIHLPVRLC